MDLEKSRQEFAKLQKKMFAITYAIGLMFLDAETAAPTCTAANRDLTLGILSNDLHNLKFGERTADLMEYLLENREQLNPVEQRSLDVLKRESDRQKSIPAEEYAQYQSLLVRSREAWHTASEEDDYELFRPYLEQVFGRAREFASYCNSEMDPYDYCLDRYEPGSNRQFYDGVFDDVKRDIVPLLQQIISRPPVDNSCLSGDYSAEKQKNLALYIMKLIGVDMDRVGLSSSDHPFTRSLGSHLDQRITTKYSRRDFTLSLYTVLFGCGCTMAESGQGDDLAYTLADGSSSIGVMEGQTRFYENIIGRSKPFIECIYPKLKQLFPNSLDNTSPEKLYLAINKVSARPIRIGSDEVTNNLHILVRYELEKELMSKELSFADLPEAWAEKYKEYLGIEVTNPSQGVLQDIHWADASIGYFPTAVLGNAYSALMLNKMKEEIDVADCVRRGDYAPINKWNREHIWQRMGLYSTDKLMAEFVGPEGISGDTYVAYLKDKYSKIYKL